MMKISICPVVAAWTARGWYDLDELRAHMLGCEQCKPICNETRATVTGWGGNDGFPVVDVALGDGGERWGWLWQVLPGSEPMPTRRPGALDGAAGPWP